MLSMFKGTRTLRMLLNKVRVMETKKWKRVQYICDPITGLITRITDTILDD